MGTEFDDASAVQDGNAVGVADRGDAMRDEDGGAAAHDIAQMVQDLVFGMRIDAGESIVEDQDSRIADEGAGDCGALLLASGKGDAALTDHRLVAFGKALDVGGDVGGFGGVVDLLVGGGVDSQGNVVTDAIAKQKRLLRDEADTLAERGD